MKEIDIRIFIGINDVYTLQGAAKPVLRASSDEWEARQMAKSLPLGGRMRFVSWAAGLVCVAGVTGCTGGVSPSTEATTKASAGSSGAASSPAGSSSTSAAPSWSGVPAPPEALAAYDAMWEDIMAVSETSDYKNSRIAQHMRGQPLTFWTENVARDKSRGWVGRGRPAWHARVTSVTPAEAPDRVEIADCLDTTAWVNVMAADGKPADDTPGGRHRSAAAITKDADGAWRVTQQLIGEVGTC